jgi:hypothetical protein
VVVDAAAQRGEAAVDVGGDREIDAEFAALADEPEVG